METKLLPCPFCGGKAREYGACDFPHTKYGFGCSNPECHIYMGYGQKLYETKAEAIEAWNRRANDGD